MNKIWIILAREYLTKTRNKYFIIITLFTPLLIVGILGLILFLTQKNEVKTQVNVLDESGLFINKLENTTNLTFSYIDTNLEVSKQALSRNKDYLLLHIPEISLYKVENIRLFSIDNQSVIFNSLIEEKIQNRIRSLILSNSGINSEPEKSKVSIRTINLLSLEGEKETNSVAILAIASISSLLIYIFIYLYGIQVMNGVLEEKTNRIIEVIIISVKPFQLMMGKILGIGAVALTQFLVWIALTFSLFYLSSSMLPDIFTTNEKTEISNNIDLETAQNKESSYKKLQDVLDNINIPLIIGAFIFYFIGGFLLYGSLFAAIGSAVDNSTDTQQFILPVTLPLLFSTLIFSLLLKDPSGSLTFWMSIIPFTSPIVMMLRIPYEVSFWELGISISAIIINIIFNIWVAGRIYRIGILMHGTKVNYRTFVEWFFMKT